MRAACLRRDKERRRESFAVALQRFRACFQMTLSRGDGRYAEILHDQLQNLYDTLLSEHQVETEQLRTAVMMLQVKQETQSEASEAPMGHYDSVEVVGRWLELSERLLEVGRDLSYDYEEESEEEAEMPLVLEGLQMRKAWSVGLQEAQILHRARNYRTSNIASSSTLRMNDILRDPSCLQKLVLKPRNPLQLLWSFLGSVFILWDLITIPLEMFDIPSFISFLENFGNVTLAFWILDVPSNLIFGREIKGKVELRPVQLAKEYMYSLLTARSARLRVNLKRTYIYI